MASSCDAARAVPLSVVVLAAGKGSRMRGALPKVLHPIAAVPMLVRVVRTALALSPDSLVIVYADAQQKTAFFQALSAHISLDAMSVLQWVMQSVPRGTGHAVSQALPVLTNGLTQAQKMRLRVLVLYADVPLLPARTLAALIAATPEHAVGILTFSPTDPTGLGRVLRDKSGQICAIVEEKEANAHQQQIKEVSSGVLVADHAFFSYYLPQVTCHNAQQEYYLPDVIAMAVRANRAVIGVHSQDPDACRGVNDKVALAAVERIFQRQLADRLMREHGVCFMDPARFDCRGHLQVGQGVCIDINVTVLGQVTLGDGVSIGPGVVLNNVVIAENTVVHAYSVLENSRIKAGCAVGPFAYLRGGCHLGEKTQMGCFVEAKNVRTGTASKAKHLSYLGDTVIGNAVNIGAGVITCNYDGHHKASTHIADGAFIGSDCQLVAPVTVGADAYVGAGSTITKSVPAGALALSRVVQRIMPNWVGKRRKQRADKVE